VCYEQQFVRHFRQIAESSKQVDDDAMMMCNQCTVPDHNAACMNAQLGGDSDVIEALSACEVTDADYMSCPSQADAAAVIMPRDCTANMASDAADTACASGVSTTEDAPPAISQSSCTVAPDFVKHGTPLSSLGRRATLSSVFCFMFFCLFIVSFNLSVF